MSDNLFDSPKITLAWAKHHLNNFHTKLANISSDNHRTDIIEKNADGLTEAHKIKLDKKLFDDLACIAFDFTNNLRSVLDQMAFQIGRRHIGKDPSAAKFPFVTDGAHLSNHVKGACKDLPPEIRALFVSFKPYKTGNPALWALNEIANSTKHFALIPVVIDPVYIGVHVGKASALFTQRWDHEKYEMTVLNAPIGFKLQDKTAISFNVRFNHREPVIAHKLAVPFLNTMLGIVESILLSTEAECRRINSCA
jgi:hypothetical protein